MYTQSRPQLNFVADPTFKKIERCFKFADPKYVDEDFGHIIKSKPLGFFNPKKVEDLQDFLRLASKYAIKVTCRGRGNSSLGQSQAPGGVIIDLKDMLLPMEIGKDKVTVPAFKSWYDLIEYLMESKTTVPVRVDNLELTVGGTLSFAALSGESYRQGCGADNVLSLDVMTIDGELHKCSETENSELFNAVLCGMGQFGIIISADLRTVPAKQFAIQYMLEYDDHNKFLRDQKNIYDAKLFNYLKGFVIKDKTTQKWTFIIEATYYCDAKDDSTAQNKLKELNLTPVLQRENTRDYWQFINSVTGYVQALRANNNLDVPHPWFNVFVPDHHIAAQLSKLIESPMVSGADPILIYPLDHTKFTRPLLMLPASDNFYMLEVYQNTSNQSKRTLPYQDYLDWNKQQFCEARKAGAKRICFGAIPFDQGDWEKHFGEKWGEVCALKEKYDPQHLLGTGLGMFPEPEQKQKLVRMNSMR